MLKNASVLFIGNILLAVFNLGRNILIARLLPVEQFGIATTFNVLLAAVTMAMGLNLGQLLIQAKDGDDRAFQATLQTIQICMGLTVATLMFLGAGSYAQVMTVPEATWGFQLMALIARLGGLQHFDIYRLQREMQFLPLVFVTTAGVVISTLAVWPLYEIFGDYRVMLYTLLLQQTIALSLSHIMARSSYRLNWDSAVVMRALTFSAPLLLNGVFLFGIFNGERLIVANRFGLEELAWFSVGFMLTMMPVNLLSKSLQSLFLPILSRHQDNDDAFSYTAVTACQATVVPGLALALGFALFGPTVIGLLYGEKYLPAVGIVVLLAVMQGIRLAQAGAVVSALARAQSRIPLYITITRFAFIPLAFLAVLYLQVGILSLVIIGIAGEIAALVLAYSMLWARLRVRISQLGPGLLLAGTVLAVIIWQVVTIKMETGLWGGIHSGQIVPIGLLLLSPLVFRNLWAEGLALLRRRRD